MGLLSPGMLNAVVLPALLPEEWRQAEEVAWAPLPSAPTATHPSKLPVRRAAATAGPPSSNMGPQDGAASQPGELCEHLI